jgi:hypothetical protein
MKKILLLTAAVILLSFAADKFITIKFTEAQVNFHWNSLNQIKALIDKSELPHNQVVFITKSIDSLQHDIQLSARIDSTIKK